MLFYEANLENSSKHKDYFSIYDEIFYKQNFDRLKNYNILEIGVDKGSGLRALKKYFPNSNIFGLDIKSECKHHEEENIKIFINSQINDDALNELSNLNLDIIIDDGSHDNNHVFYTFEKLFLNLKPGGLFIIEDIHTSYWPYYNGGYLNKNASIEKFKMIIDYMHAWCIRDSNPSHIPPYLGQSFNCPEIYEKWIKSIKFYENIIVIEKHNLPARCGKPI
jgi:hypothetical protein